VTHNKLFATRLTILGKLRTKNNNCIDSIQLYKISFLQGSKFFHFQTNEFQIFQNINVVTIDQLPIHIYIYIYMTARKMLLRKQGKIFENFKAREPFIKTPPAFGSPCIGEVSKIKFYSDLK
jgi:hypothetical protein